MAEWWTYRPSDFLMFSPRAYARLFELTNATLWPWQLLLTAALLLWALRTWRSGGRVASRGGALLAALAWSLCGWFFVHQRYAAINWVADGLALAFGVQAAALLAWALAVPRRDGAAWQRPRVAAALCAWGLVGQPLLALAGGRTWLQAEWFGAAPDPTLVATLGLLLLVRAPWWLWVLPVAVGTVSAATLATMGSAMAAVPALATVLAVVAARRRTG